MRGLTVAKKFEPVYVRMRMTDHINYFDQMKKQMKKDGLHLMKDKFTKLLKKSFDQCIEGLEMIKKEEEEAKKAGKLPIKSKIAPYIHGKSSKVGGSNQRGSIPSNKGKKKTRDDKSSASGKDSNDRMSHANSR